MIMSWPHLTDAFQELGYAIKAMELGREEYARTCCGRALYCLGKHAGATDRPMVGDMMVHRVRERIIKMDLDSMRMVYNAIEGDIKEGKEEAENE